MDLFLSERSHFRLTRISKREWSEYSRVANDFCQVVMKKEHSYPEISSWIEKQVLPELDYPGRAVYVAHLDNRPVGAVVAKGCNKQRMKLCHLQIIEEARRQGVGDVLLGLIALYSGLSAEHVYFTIPESVWEEQKGFFSKFGFQCHGQSTRQYRLFDKELYCSASFNEFSRVSLRRVGELCHNLSFGALRRNPALLLSIRPKFAEKIMDGSKTVEIRRKFSKRWVDHRVAIYASDPEQAVVGEATIDMVNVGQPEVIWDQHSSNIGCGAREYYEYCAGAPVVSAIGLRDISRFSRPLNRAEISSMFGKSVRPPQSYFLLRPTDPWSEAVSIASTLAES